MSFNGYCSSPVLVDRHGQSKGWMPDRAALIGRRCSSAVGGAAVEIREKNVDNDLNMER